MSKYVEICQNISKYVKLCQNMSKYVKLCQIMSKYGNKENYCVRKWFQKPITCGLYKVDYSMYLHSKENI